MKLTITAPEAQNLLNKYNPFSEQGIKEIEVETSNVNGPKEFYLYDMFLGMKQSFPNYKSSQKIEAIRFIRTFASDRGFIIPLTQAKNFVESL